MENSFEQIKDATICKWKDHCDNPLCLHRMQHRDSASCYLTKCKSDRAILDTCQYLKEK